MYLLTENICTFFLPFITNPENTPAGHCGAVLLEICIDSE